MKQLDCLQCQISAEVCLHILYRICKEQSDKITKEYIARQTSDKVKLPSIDGNVKSTLCYIAGAAIHNVCKKFRTTINRTHRHSVRKELNYYSLRIMSSLRSPQGHIEDKSLDAESVMSVIRKQGSKQSLTHVSDEVLLFFEHLHHNCNKYINKEMFSTLGDTVLSLCIESMQSDKTTIDKWFSLFSHIPEMCESVFSNQPHPCGNEPDSEDKDDFGDDSLELQHSIVMDLYCNVLRYFCKVQFADIRAQYVDKNRRKKQAHRAGLQSASGTAFAPEDKVDKVPYPCAVCGQECKSFFDTFEEQSVQCSICKIWLHFPCAGIKGDEPEIQEGNEDEEWLCGGCKQNRSQRNLTPVDIDDISSKGKRKGRLSSDAKASKKMKQNCHVTNSNATDLSMSMCGRICKPTKKFN